MMPRPTISDLEINLTIALDTLSKISRGLYPDPALSAESTIQISQFYLDQHGRLVKRDDAAGNWVNWLEQQEHANQPY